MSSETRRLAIKNLKGSDEELRVSWMLDNMKENKTFHYLNKKNQNPNELLLKLKKEYKNYRLKWRENPKMNWKLNILVVQLNLHQILHHIINR